MQQFNKIVQLREYCFLGGVQGVGALAQDNKVLSILYGRQVWATKSRHVYSYAFDSGGGQQGLTIDFGLVLRSEILGSWFFLE